MIVSTDESARHWAAQIEGYPLVVGAFKRTVESEYAAVPGVEVSLVPDGIIAAAKIDDAQNIIAVRSGVPSHYRYFVKRPG